MRTHTKRPSRFALLATAVAATALMGGSAFTAGNTFGTGATEPVTGYGETTVSGATVTSLSYTLSANGSNVNSVTLKLSGDTTTSDSVAIGFNDGATTACGTGSFLTDATTYTCPGTGSFTQETGTLTKTAVVVK